MDQAAQMLERGDLTGIKLLILPSAVYTIPEIAMVGDTEQEVHAAGIDYVIGRAYYKDNPRGCIIGEQDGFLKLILRRQDLKILGVHAIG